MSKFSRRRGEQSVPASADEMEDPVVRQYRYLLRSAPADALEAAHVEALPQLSEAHRQAVLQAVRSSLLVGDHLTTADVGPLAHLVTSGERRTPGALLSALPGEVQQDLAARVLESEASFGLLGGYAHWDGAEPEPPDDSLWRDGGFTPQVGQGDPRNDPRVGKGFSYGGGQGGP